MRPSCVNDVLSFHVNDLLSSSVSDVLSSYIRRVLARNAPVVMQILNLEICERSSSQQLPERLHPAIVFGWVHLGT